MPFKNKEDKNKNDYLRQFGTKIKCINYLGGKCQICGETNIHVLCFHHIDPTTKKFNILGCKNRRMSFEHLKPELDKCQLLCINCHKELHYNQNKRINVSVYKTRFSKQLFLTYKNMFSCEICGYNKCNAALQFHHIDPSKKEIQIQKLLRCRYTSIENFSKQTCEELDKCQVLCSNCHQLKHTDVNRYNKYEEEIKYWVDSSIPLQLKFTDEQLLEDVKNGMYIAQIKKKHNCSKVTVGDRLRRLKITDYKRCPTKKFTDEQLIEDVKEGLYSVQIARKYKCGKAAVCERLQKLGITDYKKYPHKSKQLNSP